MHPHFIFHQHISPESIVMHYHVLRCSAGTFPKCAVVFLKFNVIAMHQPIQCCTTENLVSPSSSCLKQLSSTGVIKGLYRPNSGQCDWASLMSVLYLHLLSWLPITYPVREMECEDARGRREGTFIQTFQKITCTVLLEGQDRNSSTDDLIAALYAMLARQGIMQSVCCTALLFRFWQSYSRESDLMVQREYCMLSGTGICLSCICQNQQPEYYTATRYSVWEGYLRVQLVKSAYPAQVYY